MTNLQQSSQHSSNQGLVNPGSVKDSFSADQKSGHKNFNPGDWLRLLTDLESQNALILREISEIKKQIRWQKTWGLVRFLLIALPIAVGLVYSLFYLPPELRESLEFYRSLLRP